jgi:hypothetical protein
MIGKLLRKALLYTFYIHLFLFIVFMFGFVIDKEKYGKDYINEGIYFNVLFLQFTPITYALVFLGLFIFHKFIRKGNT